MKQILLTQMTNGICLSPRHWKIARKASQPLTFWKAFYTFQIMSIMNSLSQCKCLIYHTSLETIILGLGLLGHQQALLPVRLCANICPAAPTEIHARPKVARQHPRCIKHQASSPALKKLLGKIGWWECTSLHKDPAFRRRDALLLSQEIFGCTICPW